MARGLEQRVGALDGVRGLAVLLVVVGHISGAAFPYASNVGVTLFFALSGYLITSLLVREKEQSGRIDLRAFYIRRALRLYPAFLLFLALTPLLLWVAGDPRLGTYPVRAVLAGLYLADFAEASGHGLEYLTHTWSLAVEEQFYLVWPAALLALTALAARRDRRTGLPMLVGIAAGLALAWRLAAMVLLDTDRVYFAPDTNAFALLAGSLLAVVPRGALRLPSAVRLFPLGVLGVLSVLPAAGQSGNPVVRDAVVVLAGLVAVVAVADAARGSRLLEMAWLRWFGTISYGLYLWHALLLALESNGQELSGWHRAVAAAAAVPIAAASFYWFERPLLRVKRRWERARIADAHDQPLRISGYAGQS